ncbi:MAG: molybdopterin-dependent oxidoreductase [Parvibaculaceae bacterium]
MLVDLPRGQNEKVHSSHWGSFIVGGDASTLRIRPNPNDADPSPLLDNIAESVRHHSRVAHPAVRRGWLERGPGPDDRRGDDVYVRMGWDEVLDRLAAELTRVKEKHGNTAIYGGSYGWASAGRVHHAQSQVHRFLNCIGGYTASRNSYSGGAAEVILPLVMGDYATARSGTNWLEVERSTELVVAFGGMAEKNGRVSGGGAGRPIIGQALRTAQDRGAKFILISPIRDDFPGSIDAEWLPIAPGTDTALMLGIAHALVNEGLHDTDFLTRCCTGYEIFERYLLGLDDGQPKSADWAAAITGIGAGDIAALARRMASRRTLITVAHALQRAEHGEQPVWMGMVLAAMLGGIGRDGCGYLYSMGSLANVGKPRPLTSVPAISQGENPIGAFIPVARISDMLLNPGQPFQYNGQNLVYPEIRLVYWAGGNPFHHHQDLTRLRHAFAKPDTIIIHDPFWTSSAWHADIVLPSTISLERNDIGGGSEDNVVTAMQQALAPFAEARNDYDIFADLAARLGAEETFTEGRTADDWVHTIYSGFAQRLRQNGIDPPSFESFWEAGEIEMPVADYGTQWSRSFRENPEAFPIRTPSGKLEIFSSHIDAFNYADCPGHPVWIPPAEGEGSPIQARRPLHLVANQPPGRLHSQCDFAAASRTTKVEGREQLRLSPADAAARGIADGNIVRVFNDRGAFLASALISGNIRPGVIQIATGAWYDPVDGLCVAGNPNAVTRDVGTSRLAQGSTGQLCLVEMEKFIGTPPKGRGHAAPPIIPREQAKVATDARTDRQ